MPNRPVCYLEGSLGQTALRQQGVEDLFFGLSGENRNHFSESNCHSHGVQKGENYYGAFPSTILRGPTTNKLSFSNRGNHAFSSLPLNSLTDPASATSPDSLFQSFTTPTAIDLLRNPIFLLSHDRLLDAFQWSILPYLEYGPTVIP